MSLLHRHKKERAKPTTITHALAGSFFLICLGVLLVIIYISFSWATITITPKEVQDEYGLRVPIIRSDDEHNATQDAAEEGILGTVEDIRVNHQETFPVQIQESKKKQERMSGIITLVNTSPKDQPLIASTRLQQSGGLLFRTQQSVVVGAGKRVEVPVKADTDGSYEVTNAHFILLGLWSGLQNQIYGVSFVPQSLTIRESGILTQKDIDEARKKVHEELEKNIQSKVDEFSSGFTGKKVVILPHSEEDLEVDHKVGERLAEFTVKLKGTIHVLVINENQGYKFLLKKLKEKEGLEYSFAPIKNEDITYLFDPETNKNLMVKAIVQVTKRLTSQHITVNKKNFLNKRADEISVALKNYPDVAEVQVRFYPFWITRAPLLVDHIHILVKE